QIEAIIAPPGFRSKPKTDSNKSFRIRGSNFNSRFCVSCREGGQLVCCDDCPASFHLLCHEPPLTIDDLPKGRWICHRCENSEVNADENLPSTSEEMCEKNAAVFAAKGRDDDRAKKVSDSERNIIAAISAISKNESRTTHPLLLLAKAASVMNSSEFVLPPEFRNELEFPGIADVAPPGQELICLLALDRLKQISQQSSIRLNPPQHFNERQFEILCYSRYGIKVNGVSYSISLDSSSDALPAYDFYANLNEDRVRTCVPELLFHTYCDSRPSPKHQIGRLLHSACLCDEEKCSSSPWDGGAVLHHGALVEFGCLKFVFADTNRSLSCTSFV
ncbi:unnamed protein product, partial [Soboliphyme baturini]|uniref:PHD-type domain-containing protein n=1 Tax=Soboliphyme baturini TaxID=241478 RepID=A0A183IHC5_9BILA